MNIIFWTAGLSILIFIVSFVWMKFRMKVSKGRFAMTVLSSLISCFIFALTAMSNSLPSSIISVISEKMGLGSIDTNPSALVVIILTGLIGYFIYKFGSNAVKTWEVPPRVSEIDLAEKHLENNILALSVEKWKLLLKRKKDPIASDAIANWKSKITEPPKPIETKDLLRDMLTASIREINILDDGWRDEGKMWIGKILGLTESESEKVLVLIFDSQPNSNDLEERIKFLQGRFTKINDFQLFALYLYSDKDYQKNESFKVSDCEIRIMSSREMLLKSLDLTNYAKELISNFENTRVGGTSATLSSSYVNLYIKTTEKTNAITPLDKAIEEWLQKDSNCHLAITGEYGQGKSTALMKFCIDWAKRFLETGLIGERVPLLIELRGQSPSEEDPLRFISSWCARYRLLPQQVLNLIKSGNAILIFEGFDELRNAGKSYFRHQHFNALWRFSYPNTKLIFTGRPNFFLDEEERNRTLRSQTNRVIGGDYYTQVWELQKLDITQIKLACRSYEPKVKAGIISSIKRSDIFLDIVSRPSMLPVVATIWPDIEELQKVGHQLTGAELIEIYIQAVFSRKEAELEKDKIKLDAPSGSRYLLLPKQLRELLTICVAWRMSGLKYKNTIPRLEVTEMVYEIYDLLITISKSQGVSPTVAEGIIDFEKRYEGESIADKVEAITTEICSAGLLIPDPAGGATNLRFPHKQFFEFLIAKAVTIITKSEKGGASQIILKSSNDSGIIRRLINEPISIDYLSECIGQNIGIFLTKFQTYKIKISVIAHLFRNRSDFFVAYCSYKVAKIMKLRRSFQLKKKLLIINKYKSHYDEIENEDETKSFLQIIRPRKVFMHSSFLVMFSLVIAMIIDILFNLLSTIIIYNDFKFLVLSLISISYVFFVNNLFLIRQNDHHVVFTKFLKAHWKRAGQVPKNKSDELKITLNSLFKRKIIFPVAQITETSDLEQFLYPAQYFGNH